MGKNGVLSFFAFGPNLKIREFVPALKKKEKEQIMGHFFKKTRFFWQKTKMCY